MGLWGPRSPQRSRLEKCSGTQTRARSEEPAPHARPSPSAWSGTIPKATPAPSPNPLWECGPGNRSEGTWGPTPASPSFVRVPPPSLANACSPPRQGRAQGHTPVGNQPSWQLSRLLWLSTRLQLRPRLPTRPRQGHFKAVSCRLQHMVALHWLTAFTWVVLCMQRVPGTELGAQAPGTCAQCLPRRSSVQDRAWHRKEGVSE